MSHGICEDDRGVVWGNTWHNLPQYVTLDRPVTYEEAHEILSFPMKLQPLYREDYLGMMSPAQAWEIVRTDTGSVLVPMVGKRFSLIGNEKLLEHVQQTVLKEYPQLQIESVGTLWHGATAFVNLKMEEWGIPGDHSKMLNRIMWWNPLGKGSYRTCAHNVRVVCANTLAAASKVDAGTQARIRHTRNSGVKLEQALTDLVQHFKQLAELQKKLTGLAKVPMKDEQPRLFLKRLLPIPGTLEKDDPIASMGTWQFKMRQLFHNRFCRSTDRGMEWDVARSRYGMLQAITEETDHEKTTPSKDRGYILWDGIVGGRAEFKARALELLTTVDTFKETL